MLRPNIPTWKIVLIVLFIIAALFANYWVLTRSYAEEYEDIECWVLCQPDSYVNVRMSPKKKSMETGRLECGDKVYTDGTIKNGFLYIYGLNTEDGEGWVHKGYIVYDEPYTPFLVNTNIVSNGRVAARRTINGKRRCWLKDGQSIKVYMMSEEWSVTNKGFVKSKFIETGR